MKRILIVEVSPRGAASASREVSRFLSTRLRAALPGAELVYRDLAKNPLPHLDDSTIKAMASKDPAEVEANKKSAEISDQLIGELLAADLVVIATPMWNFGIPSSLKAWIDLIVRPGKTFNYTETGVLGLVKDKKAILVLSSGGVFTQGPWKPWDFVEPYLRQILKFIGIETIETVRVEGLNIPVFAGEAVAKACQAINELVL